jgi:fatty-acyl-CoA synthase
MTTLVDRLEERYRRSPERVAVHCLTCDAAQPLTYKTLLDGAAGVARNFTVAGVRKDDVVLLILPHGRDLLVSFFGALLSGGVPSILAFPSEKLDPRRYARSLAALIDVTRPAALLTDKSFEREVNGALADKDSPPQILLAGDLEVEQDGYLKILPGHKHSPDDTALLQHSSGTTGLQKGVALSHRSILTHVERYAGMIQLDAQDVVVSWLPLYHDMGLIAGFLMPVLLGATLVLMSPLDWVRAPYRLLDAVSRYNGTLSWLPNFAFNFCAQKIREGDMENVDLSTWRAVINCSEPMRLESHMQFIERFKPYGLHPEALATSYAMAENVFAVTQSAIGSPVNVDWVDRRVFREKHLARPAGAEQESIAILSAGKPLPKTQVHILDEERSEVPPRVVGEIAIKSDTLLTGYYRREDLTQDAFHDGWFLTGDLGYLFGGELYVTGRSKEIIIVGGTNVYPQDLEALAGEVDGVHPGRAVAFGLFNEQLGTEDVTVVVEGDVEDPDERARLADAVRLAINRGSDVSVRHVRVVPRGWVIKTSSGKLARDANRRRFIEEFLSASEAERTPEDGSGA